jgi:4-hydroxy-3-methylbut-2-enyl diphosphate reductase
VHKEAVLHHRRGKDIVLIGHSSHPEVIGTMGQLPAGAVTLVETIADVEALTPADAENLAWITQTTLSIDDTREMVAALQKRFPSIVGPHKDDICYATTNRQEAVKVVAPRVDAMVIVGAPNSSNSQRLREVAAKSGCPRAVLVQRAEQLDWSLFEGIETLGVSAGASAPEALVEEIIAAFEARYTLSVETVRTIEEDVEFMIPRLLREPLPTAAA